jgi:hypothetical protein
MAGNTGKRGRAVELSTNSTTRKNDTEQKNGLFGNTNTVLPVTTSNTELNVVNLFSIGANNGKGERKGAEPFTHQVQLHGPQGEVVRVRANIDDGAMREVMSLTTFKRVGHRLGKTLPSSQLLRVANGVVIKSEAKWKGRIEANGVSTEVIFEVFDSGGKWDFLFGKTLLESFRAIHNYESDEITLRGHGGETVLRNQARIITWAQPITQPPITAPICVVTDETQPETDEKLAEVDVEALRNDTNLFTRMTDPHKPERVQELLRLITIGNDLSTDERQVVEQLIKDFADIFALSVSEVKTVENAIHHLDIPSNWMQYFR